MKRLLCCLLLFVAACSARADVRGQSSAILGGELSQRHPAVGFVTAGGMLCTGTVIDTRRVLTAAHCAFSDDELLAPEAIQFGLGAQIGEPDVVIAAQAIRVHPEYEPGSSGQLHDLAIIELDTDVDVTPIAILSEPVPVGAEVELVGYGRNVNPGDESNESGHKRRVKVRVGGRRAHLWYHDYVSGRGACLGDSGGPALLSMGSVAALVGTTAYADPDCAVRGYFTRLETHLAFLGVEDTLTMDDLLQSAFVEVETDFELERQRVLRRDAGADVVEVASDAQGCQAAPTRAFPLPFLFGLWVLRRWCQARSRGRPSPQAGLR